MNQAPSGPPAAGMVPVNGVAPGPPKVRRKKQVADPFLSANNRKKPLVAPRSTPPPPRVPPAQTPNRSRLDPASIRMLPSQSQPLPSQNVIPSNRLYKEYKLVTSKRELLQGLRYHVMHLAVENPPDIRDENQFLRPVHLNRRDPRYDGQAVVKEEGEEPKDGFTVEEREEINKRKEARAKERESNLAQVAPSTAVKRTNPKKKTQQVYRAELSEADKRRIQINYEEKLPWVLQDDENKHILVSDHQVGATTVHAAFIEEQGPDGAKMFRLLPIEKVYNFNSKKKVVKQDINEVEKLMKRRGVAPSWLAEHEQKRMRDNFMEQEARKARGLYLAPVNDTAAGRGGEDADMDFEDDFADDEEGDLFEEKGDEEKDAEKKIKEDQLQANFLDFKDERDYDVAEERETKAELARKLHSRDIRRALEKREKNYNHASDSDADSSSESDEERERLEREKSLKAKEEEEKKSGVSSGTNTPSGRREKHATADSTLPRGTKRPGSPNMSDASGTDRSVRKKRKAKHAGNPPTSVPSRPLSPDNANLEPSSNTRVLARAASFVGSNPGSDTEGGAMSDTGTRRIKLRMNGANSPTRTSPPASRAGSPGPGGQSTRAPSPPIPDRMPTREEILARVPDEGIETGAFLGEWRGHMKNPEFKSLLKLLITTKNKKIYRRGNEPMEAKPNGSGGTSG